MMTTNEARRWLASGFDGVNALTDAEVNEGALLLSDAHRAQSAFASASKANELRALAHLEQKDKLWDSFKERHGLRPRDLSKAP